ncbi:hypothetical protein [Bremerella cremea]|nr:hypothetical protein [Bremerella cremea]
MKQFQPLLLLACGVFTALTGCGGTSGPKTVDVTGKVSLDGTPVDSGQIYFRAEDGSNTYATKIEKGAYEAKVTPGAKKIEIIGYRDIPGKFVEVNPGEKEPAREMFIPRQFNSDSTLSLNIGEDQSKLEENFELKTKG